MFTPAITASSTSAPAVIILNALATQVSPSSSLDLLPFADETTTGLVARFVKIRGASPAAAKSVGATGTSLATSAPTPAAATNSLRLTLFFIRLLLLDSWIRFVGTARLRHVGRRGTFVTLAVHRFDAKHQLIDRGVFQSQFPDIARPNLT